MPMVSGTIEFCRANSEHTVQFTRLPTRMTRTGHLAEPEPGDDEAAGDEGQADEAEEEAPGLHRHQREPVAVEQRHEHAGEQVVEGGEER